MAEKNKTKEPVKIMLFEKGSSGLNEYSGFVQEAYNTKLTWPTVYPLYNRLRRSNPEVSLVRLAFMSWARNIDIEVDAPEEPTADDLAYKDFLLSQHLQDSY